MTPLTFSRVILAARCFIGGVNPSERGGDAAALGRGKFTKIPPPHSGLPPGAGQQSSVPRHCADTDWICITETQKRIHSKKSEL